MILRIVDAVVCGSQALRLTFSDGTRKAVQVTPLLCGPVFEPLRVPEYFAQVELDRVCGTVVWPNGADLARKPCMNLPRSKKPQPKPQNPEEGTLCGDSRESGK